MIKIQPKNQVLKGLSKIVKLVKKLNIALTKGFAFNLILNHSLSYQKSIGQQLKKELRISMAGFVFFILF